MKVRAPDKSNVKAKNTLLTSNVVNKVFQPRCGHLISQIHFATSERTYQLKSVQIGGKNND